MYLTAVDRAFGVDIDYAQLLKIYSSETTCRYSPPKCVGCEQREVNGSPDPKHISTSYVQRQSLTMRMHMRRLTRLTKCILKEGRDACACRGDSLHVVQLREDPPDIEDDAAMAAGVTDRLWEAEDIIRLLPDAD